jgi:hypothetical protein
MPQFDKFRRQWKAIAVRSTLALVLLLTSSMPTLYANDETGNTGDTVGTLTHRHELILAPPSLAAPAAQPLQSLAPSVTGVPAVEGLLPQVWMPMVGQGGEPQEVVEVTTAAITNPTIDMKLLVIAGDGLETDYLYVRSYLDQLGIPYDVLVASTTPLTANMLFSGTHGYYQGIILITSNLLWFNPGTNQWESAFTSAEWSTLWQYERDFGVRQVTSYTFPDAFPQHLGLTLASQVDTTSAALNVTLTDAGKQVYSYLNLNNPIAVKNAWVYLANVTLPGDASVSSVTPLVVSGSNVVAAVTNFADGRQNLAVMAANNTFLVHSLLLSYGTVNWLTKGLFLGERHVYMSAQPDDLFIPSNLWNTQTMTDTNNNYTYRLTGADLTAVVTWQNNLRSTFPLVGNFAVEWPFNGEGACAVPAPTCLVQNDTLTPAVIANKEQFMFLSHTLTHIDLDFITATETRNELFNNHSIAVNDLGLTRYNKESMVEPNISGLYNPQFQRGARTFGIKYLISDTSRQGWSNPSPNAGFYATYQPDMLVIPRRPTNIFYNVSNPTEVASEYNCYYGPNATCAGGQFSFWPSNQTYAQIIDHESDNWLLYMLKWDMDPLMFHQANMRAYNGANSVAGDLIEATLTKYSNSYNVPIVNLSQRDIGIRMAERMTYNASGVTASRTNCTITLTAAQAAKIPLTGIATGANVENYAGQSISYIELAAGQTVTIPVPNCS